MKAKHSTKKDGRGKGGRVSASASPFNGKLREPKSSSNMVAESSESQDEVDFGLPSLVNVDKEKNLLCFTSILAKPETEIVTLDELDHLQPELETLLNASILSQRTLQSKIDHLNNPQEELVLEKSSGQQKRRKLNDGRVAKSVKELAKTRDSVSKASSVSSSENETDNSTDALPEESPSKSNAGKLASPKNDTSNKFWSSIESYCSEITGDNVKELEQLIECCDNDMAGIKIPPVGRHYTERWAEQEISQERHMNSGRNISNSSDSEAVSLLKKASNLCHDRSPGPLVQRLVSALLEDPSRDSFFQKTCEDTDASVFINKIPLYHTTACFERRIRRELEAAGFLDNENNDAEDEILSEIRKCEAELKIVASQNKDHLSRLLREAKIEMDRQKVKNQLDIVDKKIVAMYKKAVAPKLKKKHLKEEKRRQAWKLMKERDALLSSLNSL